MFSVMAAVQAMVPLAASPIYGFMYRETLGNVILSHIGSTHLLFSILLNFHSISFLLNEISTETEQKLNKNGT